MSEAALLVIGLAAGGAVNTAVQLYLRRVDQRRATRLAARVLIAEFEEISSQMINRSDGRYEPEHLLAAWREHRAALGDLGIKRWRAVQEAVTYAVDSDQFPRGHPSVVPWERFEVATIAVQDHARLPGDEPYGSLPGLTDSPSRLSRWRRKLLRLGSSSHSRAQRD